MKTNILILNGKVAILVKGNFILMSYETYKEVYK